MIAVWLLARRREDIGSLTQVFGVARLNTRRGPPPDASVWFVRNERAPRHRKPEFLDIGHAKLAQTFSEGLQDLPLSLVGCAFGFPKPEATEKSVLVFSALDSFRQLIESVHVTAAEHDIIGDE